MPVNQYDPEHRTFSNDDDVLIQQLYSDKTFGDIAAKLGRSEDAVRRRALLLSLPEKSRPNAIKWTPEKLNFLRRHYNTPDWPGERLAEHLGCTKIALYTQADAMGLKNQRHRFSDEDDALIRQQYGTRNIEEIAVSLGVSRQTIMRRARKLGIAGKLQTINYSPETDKKMLEMAESGIPLQVIADEMNKTKEAIKMRLKRIRKARREALKEAQKA